MAGHDGLQEQDVGLRVQEFSAEGWSPHGVGFTFGVRVYGSEVHCVGLLRI